MKKVVVTNRKALSKKYGADLSAVDSALEALIEADRQRRTITEVIDLQVDAADSRQNKDAIDAAIKAALPDFILIVGASDVVPHQDLLNPLHGAAGSDDPDQIAWSDLPYASSGPYSRDPAAFLAPNHAVGRLPDVIGAGGDPGGLAALIRQAASWTSRARSNYGEPFSLAAQAWEHSTAQSLLVAFRSNAGLATSPERGPRWSDEELARLSYFINCHGEPKSPAFRGESADGAARPVALESSSLERHVSSGAVASIECSYAGQQHADSFTSVFLRNGGHGCFVSTTAAYGAAETNAHADILCQLFMANVMRGMTLGHAALRARLSFLRTQRVLGPIDLKTLAQFYLAGDPSIQAVAEVATRVQARAGVAVPMGRRTTAATTVSDEVSSAVPTVLSHRK